MITNHGPLVKARPSAAVVGIPFKRQGSLDGGQLPSSLSSQVVYFNFNKAKCKIYYLEIWCWIWTFFGGVWTLELEFWAHIKYNNFFVWHLISWFFFLVLPIIVTALLKNLTNGDIMVKICHVEQFSNTPNSIQFKLQEVLFSLSVPYFVFALLVVCLML